MSGDVSGCYVSGRAAGISGVEARDAVEHLAAVDKRAPDTRARALSVARGSSVSSCSFRTAQELSMLLCCCCLMFCFYFYPPLTVIVHVILKFNPHISRCVFSHFFMQIRLSWITSTVLSTYVFISLVSVC